MLCLWVSRLTNACGLEFGKPFPRGIARNRCLFVQGRQHEEYRKRRSGSRRLPPEVAAERFLKLKQLSY